MTSSDDLVRQAKADPGRVDSPVPRLHRAVLTCMDVRVDPLPALSLRPGDAHVMRNAGGVVTEDMVRSLIASQRRLETQSIDVMMHTDCGMLGLDELRLAAEIEADSGRPPAHGFHAFEELEEELRRGVEKLRREPALPHRNAIRGLVYDVASGRVRTVVG